MIGIDTKIKIVNILKLDSTYKNKLRTWRNQDFVRKNMLHQEIILEEEHKKFLGNLELRKDKKFFIAFENQEPFGVLYYTYFEKENNLEFGYYLINEKDINSGLGVVLEYTLLEHAFNELMVQKVFCRTLGFNNKVINMHKKFGFLTEKVLTEYIHLNKRYEDLHFQNITKDSWVERKERIKPLIDFFCRTENIEIFS